VVIIDAAFDVLCAQLTHDLFAIAKFSLDFELGLTSVEQHKYM